jgi:hypothetical protein
MSLFQRLKFRFFPPKSIVVIINGGDVAKAGSFHLPDECLMTTALKLRGYHVCSRRASFPAWDYLLNRRYYFRVDMSPISRAYVGSPEYKGRAYDPSIIGTRFELTRV